MKALLITSKCLLLFSYIHSMDRHIQQGRWTLIQQNSINVKMNSLERMDGVATAHLILAHERLQDYILFYHFSW